MIETRLRWLLPLTALLFVACDNPAETPDAEVGFDAGEADDAGADGGMDAGPGDRDAGETDAGIDSGSAPIDAGPIDAGPIDAGPLNPLGPRVDNTTCRFPPGAGLGSYTFPDAFPALSGFNRPVWVGVAPGEDDALYVAEQQTGRIYVFDDDPAVSSRTIFLEQTVRSVGNEEGLLGVAFHPDYATNGRFFIHYSSSTGCNSSSRCGVISELSRMSPRVADDSSETRLLVVDQPYGNHNGGSIAFGPDGRLYISLGDGGSARDPLNSGQSPTTLLGSILRVDVDNVPPGSTYGIPPSNPFAAGVGGAPEVWAWGIRNTWRMSFDRATGELWGGDVGQNAFEEVNRLRIGNFGWRLREGSGCHQVPTCAGDFIDPVVEYPHTQGRSITGGVVYRGAALSELWGQYLFADFVSGRVWAYDPSTGDDVVLVDTSHNISTFGEDPAGEVLFAAFDGRIRRIERSSAPPPALPATLTATGCFANVATLEPAAGVIAYDVNAELHSDGAAKQRWLALPAGESGTVSASDGRVTFPIGTVFIKHFEIEEDGVGTRRLETRFLVQSSQGFRGFTYRWNSAQTEADLLEGDASDTFASGGSNLTWSYPSRAACSNCHTQAAGEVLGFRTQQLDRVMDYSGVAYPQLSALTEAGYLSGSAALPAYPAIDDAGASIESRARAYLAANCAMCHQPSGPGNATIDLRFDVALADTGTCDATPAQGDLGLSGARVIAPGQPASSVLHARMNRRGLDQMPPLATERVDAEAVSVIEQWIGGLAGCP